MSETASTSCSAAQVSIGSSSQTSEIMSEMGCASTKDDADFFRASKHADFSHGAEVRGSMRRMVMGTKFLAMFAVLWLENETGDGEVLERLRRHVLSALVLGDDMMLVLGWL